MNGCLFDALARFDGEYLSFPPFARAIEEIEESLQLYRRTGVARHLVVYGETGTGKTTLCRLLLQRYARFALPERDVIPVLYVPIPSAATIASVTEAMLTDLGDPSPVLGSVSAKTARVERLAKACGVELILFDEAQHIQDRGQLPTQYMVGDWLKTVVDKIAVPTVLLGLPRIEALLRVNEQLRRRFTRRIDMALGQDSNIPLQMECLQLFNSLGTALPVPLSCGELGWDELGTRLVIATGGRVAYVKLLLSGAIRVAVKLELPAITPTELEMAFTAEIWTEGIVALNPFNPKFEFRSLDRPGEPFERGIPPGTLRGVKRGDRHCVATV